jgi:hypothetical protein
MPVINTTKNTSGDPLQKLQKVLEMISKSNLVAQYVDEREKPVLTLNAIEVILNEFAEKSQNPQMTNKWIALDTKLLKALKEFQSELRILLAGQAQMGAAQSTLQAATPPEAPAPTPEPSATAPQAMDRSLPTQQKQ